MLCSWARISTDEIMQSIALPMMLPDGQAFSEWVTACAWVVHGQIHTHYIARNYHYIAL